MTRLALAITVVFLVAPGCRPFGAVGESQSSRSSPSMLAANRVKTGSAMLEIALVEIPWELLDEFETVWGQADTQFLDFETRRLLDRNGLRCGTLGTRLPGELTRLLEWTTPVSDGVIQADRRSLHSFERNPGRVHAELQQLQPGAQHWIACSPPLSHLNWFTDTGDRRKSGACFASTCGMNIGLMSADDGTVRLWLQPEIIHGQRRMRYGIDEDDFLLESRQDRLALRELNFHCRLLPGQTLLVSCTPDLIGEPPAPPPTIHDPDIADADLWDLKGLEPLPEPAPLEWGPTNTGNAFFGSYPNRTMPARFIVIRPVYIQADDLFQSGTTQRRLATSLE